MAQTRPERSHMEAQLIREKERQEKEINLKSSPSIGAYAVGEAGTSRQTTVQEQISMKIQFHQRCIEQLYELSRELDLSRAEPILNSIKDRLSDIA